MLNLEQIESKLKTPEAAGEDYREALLTAQEALNRLALLSNFIEQLSTGELINDSVYRAIRGFTSLCEEDQLVAILQLQQGSWQNVLT